MTRPAQERVRPSRGEVRPADGKVRAACDDVRAGLARAGARLEELDLAVPPLEGKLLRPLVAYAGLGPEARKEPAEGFWMGALAVQMVHEASLLHDDILDGAEQRRGRATLAAEEGTGAALIRGDRLLTAAYRAAALTGSEAFLHLFVEAVERTVAGEEAQARSAGRRVSPEDYREIVRGKSGELFGCVAALPHALEAPDGPADELLDAIREAGRRLGAVYQMVDDLLDYCPAAVPGKPALQDFDQRKWTWVVDEAGFSTLDLPRTEVLPRLFRAESGTSPARRCLARLEDEVATVLLLQEPPDGLLPALLEGWLDTAREGVRAQERAVEKAADDARSLRSASLPTGASDGHRSPGGEVLEAYLLRRARDLGGPEEWPAYFGRHSRSFRFAAWLFPTVVRRRVAAVYAFCRFTDDLVDEAGPRPDALVEGMVDAWRRLARAAYDGTPTGAPLLDRVMGDMVAADVPFRYVSDLLDGVARDVGRVRIASLEELESYTWKVASVVGGWITELVGIHDPAILQRAFHLGHAMQVTNILRDVGEDWRRDRLYLPADLMARHGVDEAMVEAVARGAGSVPAEWIDLMEHLMGIADAHYASAFEALPFLPGYFRRPVAVAARVYQGIQDEIRRNGYDNGTRRAFTSPGRKILLGLGGLLGLVRQRRGSPTLGPTRLPVLTRPADG